MKLTQTQIKSELFMEKCKLKKMNNLLSYSNVCRIQMKKMEAKKNVETAS